MKPDRFAVSVFLLLVLLFEAAPGVITANNMPDRMFKQWIPIKPVSLNNMPQLPDSQTDYVFEIRPGSALKITCEHPEQLHLQRIFFTGSGLNTPCVFLPADAEFFPGEVIVPGSPGQPVSIRVHAQTATGPLHFQQRVTFCSGIFWKSAFARIADTFTDASPGTFPFSDMFRDEILVRQLHPDFSHAADSDTSGFLQWIYESLMSRRLLDGEDVFIREFNIPGSPRRIMEEDGVVLTQPAEMTVAGPAVLYLRTRIVLRPEESGTVTAQRHILVDGIACDNGFVTTSAGTFGLRRLPVLHHNLWPPQHIPILSSAELNQYSSLIRKYLYIPSGIHRVRIDSDRPIWIQAKLTIPNHAWNFSRLHGTPFQIDSETSNSQAIERFRTLVNLGVNLVTDQEKNDPGWLSCTCASNPDDALIRLLLQDYRNTRTRNPAAMAHANRYFADPPEPLAQIAQYLTTESLRGKRYYRLPAHRESTVNVGGDGIWSLMTLFAPEPEPGNNMITIDGNPCLLKTRFKPGTDGIFTRIGVHPGLRRITPAGNMYCDQPVDGEPGEIFHVRKYLSVGTSASSACCGKYSAGPFGTEMRLLLRPAAGFSGNATLMIQFDDLPPQRISSFFPGDRNVPFAGADLDIPGNTSHFRIWSPDNSIHWVYVGIPEKRRTGNNVSKSTPVFSEESAALIRQMENPGPGWEWDETGQDALHGIAMLSASGNTKSALELFMHQPNSVRKQNQALLCALLYRAGHASRALVLGTALAENRTEVPLWFAKLMIRAALDSNHPLEAAAWIERCRDDIPTDGELALFVARLEAHWGNIPAAEAIVENVLPDHPELDTSRIRALTSPDSKCSALPEDWAVFSPNPLFVEPDMEQITTDCFRVILQDSLSESMALPDTPTLAGAEYFGMNSGESMTVTVSGPTVLRIESRPNHAASEPDSGSAFQLHSRFDSGSIRLTYPFNSPDRGSLHYPQFPTLQPGCKEVFDLPVASGLHEIHLDCVKGSGAVRVRIQIPGIDDNPRPERMPEVIQRFYAALSALREFPDPAEANVYALAETVQLLNMYPDCFPVEHLRACIQRNIYWKKIYDSDLPNTAEYIRTIQQTDNPMILGRARQIPSHHAQDHILTSRKNLHFDLSDLQPGKLTIHSAWPLQSNREIIQVLMNRRLIGTLSKKEPWMEIDRPDQNDSDLLIRFNSTDKHAVARIFVRYTNGKTTTDLQPVIKRKYLVCTPGAPIRLNVLGYGVLRLKCRGPVHPHNGKISKITVIRKSVSGSETQEYPLIGTKDPDSRIVGRPGPVCADTEIILPLTSDEKHGIKIVSGSGDVILVRIEHAVYNNAENQTGAHVPWPERSEPLPRQTADKPCVRLRTETAGTGQVMQKPGTWQFRIRYRSVDKLNDQNANDESATGEGLTGSIRYLRAFSRSGLYWDARLGATKKLDDSIDPVVFLRHKWTLNTCFKLRTTLRYAVFTQRIQGSNEFAWQTRLAFTRSFRPAPGWYIIPRITLFDYHQSLNTSDWIDMEDIPDRRVYNGFDARHHTGAVFESGIRFDVSSDLSLFSQFKTMTAGDYESGALGVWWFKAGIQGIVRNIIANIRYIERDTFGASREPNRSRIAADVTLFHWMGLNGFWEINLYDRYTFDTRSNDFRVGVTFRWNAGQMLQDFDPYTLRFKRQIERWRYRN